MKSLTSINMEENIILTDAQKQQIVELWKKNPQAPPFLREISKVIFDKEVDGRSKEGKAIKGFLAEQSFVSKPLPEKPREGLVISDAQKEYITNNAAMMTSVEMARELFGNPMLTNLNRETRAVNEYSKTLDKKVILAGISDDVPEEADYRPPRTLDRALFKINKYVHEGIDKLKMTGRQKREVNTLIGYMNTYRFSHQINTYVTNSDRDLFESSFVRYTYDKADLTQEEVDQYIVLSTEVVISSSIQAAIIRLQTLLDEQTGDVDKVKISMSLVEAINTARTEYNQCVNRQDKLLNALKTKRSERLKNERGDTASILSLVQLFKEEESRKQLIQIVNRRREVIKDEIGRLTSMDDVKCRIMGISPEEVLNG